MIDDVRQQIQDRYDDGPEFWLLNKQEHVNNTEIIQWTFRQLEVIHKLQMEGYSERRLAQLFQVSRNAIRNAIQLYVEPPPSNNRQFMDKEFIAQIQEFFQRIGLLIEEDFSPTANFTFTFRLPQLELCVDVQDNAFTNIDHVFHLKRAKTAGMSKELSFELLHYEQEKKHKWCSHNGYRYLQIPYSFKNRELDSLIPWIERG